PIQGGMIPIHRKGTVHCQGQFQGQGHEAVPGAENQVMFAILGNNLYVTGLSPQKGILKITSVKRECPIQGGMIPIHREGTVHCQGQFQGQGHGAVP
ncbi:hypothetical protein KI387_004766, partial [Taxus chinensis]